jgi:hypothetical protein
VNKTLTRKFIYVITVLTLLAMMVPAMAVSAAPDDPTLTMTVAGVADGTNGRAFNISGSVVTITASEAPLSWDLSNITTMTGYAPAAWVGGTPANNATVVQVRGIWGEANITATFAGTPDNITVSVNKKWGMIDHTSIKAPGTQYVTWNEDNKSWYAGDNVTDTVYGAFIEDGVYPVVKAAQGTILNWYLFDGSTKLDLSQGYAPDLNTYYAGLAGKAMFVQFTDPLDPGFDMWDHMSDGWLGTGAIQTVTGADGTSTINIGAWFEENVQVVVVPAYPNNPNKRVTPEITSYNFGTREMEIVPQVRWAGEKIVLQANFGMGVTGDVKFELQNQSVGSLESINNDESEQSTVWTTTDNGTASVILTSAVNGVADVTASLYRDGEGTAMNNQYFFRVYFLNFESIQLTDVDGKRANHNDGLWVPENPYNDNFPNGIASGDILTQRLNVSQDALERVQVRGYFVPPVGAQMSTRPKTTIDIDADGVTDDLDDVVAPEGRWVLPDDWARIGGYTNWQERRLHWDIMNSPLTNDGVTANDPLGDYTLGLETVAMADVIGPFTPGQETMTPSGWMLQPDNTVVPDGKLDAWDAPMPPAKVIFEIMAGPGFFKDADKTEIYYMNVGTEEAPILVYTNPFYQILIPANPLIPAFNAQAGGGYDWDSYDGVHGPYAFWTIINQPDMNAIVPSADPANYPTKVEVYSDNHGEAMVWLNGDWNLDLSIYTGKGGVDVPVDRTIGFTTVQASADYPYARVEQAIFSNTVEKEWFWSGQVLGTDSHDFGTTPDGDPIGTTDSADTKMVLSAGGYTIDNTTGASYPNELGFSKDKVVWIWATDRDGLQAGVLDPADPTMVQWRVTGGAYIPNVNANQISNYNDITRHIYLTNGFVSSLPMTPTGTITNPDRTMGYSFLRQPTKWEKMLFNKKWPALYADPTGVAPINFAVAAIDIYDDSENESTVETILTGPDFGYPGQTDGNVFYGTNVDFGASYPMDDPIVAGDANADGVVNAGDITKVERIIMGLDAPNVNADTNQDGNINMGDVVKISRIIRGLD